MSQTKIARRHVDMWALKNLHPSNVELVQRLRMADERQFGRNMDICGSISEQNTSTGKWESGWMVGIRSDIWQPSADELQRSLNGLKKKRRTILRRSVKRSGRLNTSQNEELAQRVADDETMQLTTDDIEQRRLTLKLFRNTGKRMQWKGTIEEISTAEIHNSIGSGHPLLSFAVILDGHDLVTSVQQNHRTFRIPSIFTFCFVDHRNGRCWHLAVKRKWISIGADYSIEAEGRRVAFIDGALIGLGYNATIEVTEPDLASSTDFLDLLTLFTTTVGYQRAMRRSLRRRIRAVQQGQGDRHIIETEELRLLHNPRRRAA